MPPAQPQQSDYDRLAAIIDATPLAAASKKTYKAQLRTIEEITKHRLQWSLEHPDQSWRMLNAHRRPDGSALSAQTLKACTNAITAVLKYDPEAAERHPEAQGRWREIMKGATDLVEQKYMEQRPSDRQEEQHVPWGELIAKRDELLKQDPTSPDALVLALHTMIPPLRADLGAVKIFRPPRTRPPAQGSPEEKATPNHLVIRAPKQGERLPSMLLVLNEYKTASRLGEEKFGRLTEQFPDELVEVVANSLRARPRDWLVVSGRGRPFSSGQTYSNYVREVLARVFGRPCGGVNMIRHSFANMLVELDVMPAIKQVFARKMGHTLHMHEQYRLRLNQAQAQPTGSHGQSGQACRLQCEVKCGPGPSGPSGPGPSGPSGPGPSGPSGPGLAKTAATSQPLQAQQGGTSTIQDAYRTVLGVKMRPG